MIKKGEKKAVKMVSYLNGKPIKETEEFDANGNMIHCVFSNGYEYWREFDEENRPVRFKDICGRTMKYNYHYKGHSIHSIDVNGIERFYDYDNNGNEIHFKNSEGYEYWKDYDVNGNVLKCEDSNGFTQHFEYDENGNEVYYSDSNGYSYYKEYDSNDVQKYFKEELNGSVINIQYQTL